MDKIKLLFIMTILAIVVGGILVSYDRSTHNEKEVKSYDLGDAAAPKAEISQYSHDFGNLDSKDLLFHTFEIKNTGENPLQLTDISTSCGCTSVTLEINGEDSPKFSMHGNSKWTGEVPKDKIAKVKVTFDPGFHEIHGKVERFIYIKTNDPEKQNINLEISATANF